MKKNYEDRKRGIEAILSRNDDPNTVKELKARRANLETEMINDVNRLESDFLSAENRKTREI